MKFRINPDELTFGELLDMQDGNMQSFHDMLCRFAYDDSGARMSRDKASAEIRSWTMSEFNQRIETVKSALNEPIPFQNASD